MIHPVYVRFFFFNDTATTEIYTLSLHDALPIYRVHDVVARDRPGAERAAHAPGIEPRDEPPEDGETLRLAGERLLRVLEPSPTPGQDREDDLGVGLTDAGLEGRGPEPVGLGDLRQG